jgi:ribonuclease HII
MSTSSRSSKEILVGIDEAGRGPLAGPVSVGVLAMRSRKVLKMFRGVKDSKQLSEKQREEWLRLIKKTREVAYTVSFSSHSVIDKRGISHAVRSAINRALKRLERDGFVNEHSCILLDGLLHAHPRFKNQKTIINGDATEPIIALASICAKVHRDKRLKKLAKKYPQYGFEVHKGYGTANHYKAIKKHGISPVHRRSYLKGMVDLNQKNS